MKSRLITSLSCVLLFTILFLTQNLTAQHFQKQTFSEPGVWQKNDILAEGHYNHDDHLDYLVKIDGSSTFSPQFGILINDGKGSAILHNIDLGDINAATIKSGDINGDGLDDIVIFDNDSKEIIWYESEYLSFRRKNILSSSTATGFTPYIEVKDANNDGFADIFYNTGALLRVVFGSSSGITNPKIIYSNRQPINLLDYNNDGLLDVIYSTSNTVRVYILEENNVFENLDILNTDKDYEYSNLVDIDSDGYMEIIRSYSLGNSAPGTTQKYNLIYFDNNENGINNEEESLIQNIDEVILFDRFNTNTNGDNTFILEAYQRIQVDQTFPEFKYLDQYEIDNTQAHVTQSFNQFSDYENVKIIDLDKDGDNELLWTSEKFGQVGYFKNGEINSVHSNNSPIQAFTLLKNEISGNHDAKAILKGQIENPYSLANINNKKLVLTNNHSLESFPNSNITSIQQGDINGDGTQDYILIDKVINTGGIYTLTSSNSDFIKQKITNQTANYGIYSLNDVDLDGDLDLIVAIAPSFQNVDIEDQLWIYLNDGLGNLTKQIIDDNVVITALEIADINKDQFDDIIINGSIYINSNGQFERTEVSPLEGAEDLEYGDMNNDGKIDIISLKKQEFSSTHNLHIHLQNDDGTFGNNQIDYLGNILNSSPMRRVRFSKLADFDSDGDLDIPIIYGAIDLVSVQKVGELHWMENKKDEGFVGHLIDDNVDIVSCKTIDMNSDNAPDLCCLTEDGGIETYFNNLNKSNVLVITFNDKNENGVFDASEHPYQDFQLILQDDQIISNFDEIGKRIFLDEGNHTITFDESYNTVYSLTTEASQDLTTLSNNQKDTIYFGIHSQSNLPEFSQSISHGYPRCGREIDLKVSIKNNGNQTLSGTSVLSISNNVEEITLTTSSQSSIIDNKITFIIEELHPGDEQTMFLKIRVPSVSDGIELGDVIDLELDSNLESDIETLSKTSHYRPEIRCSYDPNDKSVFPNRADSLILLDQSIQYTLRFQNTGNDTAYNISIYDTLSELLDVNTFEFLSSSHRNQLSINRNQEVVHFRFSNIYLPDSNINEEASHGFVSFQIDSKSTVTEGSHLENTAYIYFDENPPIITNTTENTLVSFITNTNAVNKEQDIITVYPNPNSGILYFNTISNRITSIELLDISGKSHRIFHNPSGMIDLSNFNSGMYILHITDDTNVTQIQKLIISK